MYIMKDMLNPKEKITKIMSYSVKVVHESLLSFISRNLRKKGVKQ